MSISKNWLTRLDRENKGIWGVVLPMGSEGLTEQDLIPSGRHIEFITLSVCRGLDEKILFKNGDDPLGRELNAITEELIKSSDEFERTSIRIIVNDFHSASPHQQSLIAKSARAIHEESKEVAIQFIFCGSWSYYAFKEEFYKLHGKTNSPAVELKNTLYAPKKNCIEVLKMLEGARLVNAAPTDMDRVACDFLIEQTGGDDFLIRRSIDYLSEKSGVWFYNIEQVLRELMESANVVANIKLRLEFLNQEARSELKKILKTHWLIRSTENLASDILRVAGLITCHPIDGNKILIRIAGPLLNAVVRNVSSSVGINGIANADDLCFEREVVSAAAHKRIAELENMLRSLVVSEWSVELAENWTSRLGSIKSPPYQLKGAKDQDLIMLVMQCMKEAFPVLSACDKVEFQNDSKAQQVQSPKIQEPVLTVAKNWQERQNLHHGFELAPNSIMHFLTTSDLRNILFHKTYGFIGENGPFTKPNLTSALDEYTAIRDAVAHNQPIALSTIDRLDTLIRKFADWLTVYADKGENVTA